MTAKEPALDFFALEQAHIIIFESNLLWSESFTFCSRKKASLASSLYFSSKIYLVRLDFYA